MSNQINLTENAEKITFTAQDNGETINVSLNESGVVVSGGGGVSDGDKGDITVSSSGATWTIDNGVVGTAKLGGDITTAGKALLDDADATAQRTTLGLSGVSTTDSITTVTGTLAAEHIHGNIAGSVYAHVRAGENLAKGDPVYVSGSHDTGANLIAVVSKARADDATKMPAIGIMDAAVSVNQNGHMVIVGNITDINTNAYAVNDTLYVGATGGLTNDAFTSNYIVQSVARVERSNTNNGAIVVKVNGLGNWASTPESIAYRDSNGNSAFNELYVDNSVFLLSSGYNAQIKSDNVSNNLIYQLPDTAGTFALDSTALMLTGNQTASGNKTLSGQLELTGQAATNNTSALTRKLFDDRDLMRIRTLFPVVSSSASGTGATQRRTTPSTGVMDGDLATSAGTGSYLLWTFCSGTLNDTFSSNGTVDFRLPWSLYFRTLHTIPSNTEVLIGIGTALGTMGSSGVPSSGTNVGIQIQNNTTVRLWRCNAGAAVYSDTGTLTNISSSSNTPTHEHYWWLENVGNGTLNLYWTPRSLSSSYPAKPTLALCTLTGVASGVTSATSIGMTFRATGTPGLTAGCWLKDVKFIEL